jgi:hypothetical protein
MANTARKACDSEESLAKSTGLVKSRLEQTRVPLDGVRVERKRPDLLRRFSATPYAANLLIMDKTIRIESNRSQIIEKGREFFVRHQGPAVGTPEFLWRIVGEADCRSDAIDIHLAAFSDLGVRYGNMGQRSFLAVDLEAREAVAFVNERAVESEPEFNCRSLFDTLFCMCAGALAVTSLSAACVGMGPKGVLVFGSPNSGKTTTSYLAARRGLELHADQAAFAEMHDGNVRVWGDLLPAIFRPESLQFLPELSTSAREFSYPDLRVHYLSKRPFQAAKAHPVAPLCCVFLDRGPGESRMLPVSRAELKRRFADNVLFDEDERFDAQSTTVLDALSAVPAYELTYRDPEMATTVLCELLADNAQ